MISTSPKIKILRVITQAEVVSWHLKNFIDRADKYDLYVTGNDVSRYRVEYPHVTFIDNEIIRKISPVRDLMALFNLIRLCIKIKPQIVHSIMPKSGLLAAIAAFLTAVPIRLHTFTGQVWSTKKGFSKILLQSIDKLIISLNTKCLTDSPSQSEYLASHRILDGGNTITCLGKGSLSGVSLKRFSLTLLNNKAKLREDLGIDTKDFVYIFLARKSVVKGIIELFESFDKIAHFPDVKLLFIGPDESDGVLQSLYAQYSHLSSKIISLDIVKDHEKYLAVADVLCLPSSSEGFGTIVIEAAALKVPSIGFNIVGLSDAIQDDKTGILVPYKNVNSFAEAMELLYMNYSKRLELSENGFNRVLKYFSADAVYQFQDNLYQELWSANFKQQLDNR